MTQHVAIPCDESSAEALRGYTKKSIQRTKSICISEANTIKTLTPTHLCTSVRFHGTFSRNLIEDRSRINVHPTKVQKSIFT